MSSSIAFAEKYLSLGSFWRAFRITASIAGEILPVQLARRRGVLVYVLPGEALDVARERRPPGQTMVEKHAHGVNVTPRRRILSPELLRGHVAGAAHDLTGRAGRVVLLDDAGDAEVGDLDGSFLRKEDVGRLDVPVDDAPPVGVGEREQELLGYPLHELLVQAAAAPVGEEVADVPAGDALDHDEGHLAILGDVVDLYDVLVVQGGHRAGLLPEAPPERGHLGVFVVEGLQRDGAAEDVVFRPVDDRHPTGTERALYLVTPRKDRSDRGFQPLTASN